MTSRGFKRTILGLAFVAAFSVAPAFASGPTLTDNGSAYWTARVAGSGFSSSGLFTARYADVYIYNYVYDDLGNLNFESSASDRVQTSSLLCARFACWTGGNFTDEHYMAPHQCGQRWAIAYDEGSGLWSSWIQLDCA